VEVSLGCVYGSVEERTRSIPSPEYRHGKQEGFWAHMHSPPISCWSNFPRISNWFVNAGTRTHYDAPHRFGLNKGWSKSRRGCGVAGAIPNSDRSALVTLQVAGTDRSPRAAGSVQGNAPSRMTTEIDWLLLDTFEWSCPIRPTQVL